MRRMVASIASGLLICAQFSSPAFGDEIEEATLVALFEATNGPAWFDNEGWLGQDYSYCGWYGVSCCGQWCNPSWIVRGLDLSENNLEGILPAEIGGFSRIARLDLSGNQLTGDLPDELGLLDDLGWLWLHDNQFEGSIPPSLGNLIGIWVLTLSGNHLTGPIPEELENLESLEQLWLGGNELEGEVPHGIWEGPRLWSLHLTGNHFFGQIPVDAEPHFRLEGLAIAENQFSGSVPRWFLGVNHPKTYVFDHNALHSDDPEILEFLSEYHEGDWLASQTLAPDWVVLVEVDETTLSLEWSGGGPVDLPGSTIIESRSSGSQWEELGQTLSRDVVTFEVGRPSDAQSRHYRLRTVTEPHEHNKNTVVSDPSYIVTFNVAGHSILPTVARLGSHGVRYSSHLDAFNPSDTDLRMELTYTPRSDFDGDSRTATWNLEAGEAQSIDDCLDHFFGPWENQPAAGSLVFRVTDGRSEDLLLQSTITALHGDGAEYGQSFPASTFAQGLQSDETHHLHLAAGRMRSNAGLVALEPGTRAHLRLVGPAGQPLNDAVFLFEGDTGKSAQLNDLWGSFWAEPTDNALLEISVQQGSVIAYGSILDGTTDQPGTSDPTTLQSFADGREIVTLLEMGTIVGHEEYSGSAVVTNTSDRGVVVTAQFHRRGWPGVEAETTFYLGAGETREFPDIAENLFGIEGVVGTITLETNARGLVASGREYAIHRNDDGEIEGTSGQLIRGLGTDDLLWPGEIHHLLGLRQDEDPKGQRVNLAAFNPASAEVRLILTLVDQASGDTEGSTEITVRGEELIHLNAVIKEINPDHDETPKRIVVTVSGALYVQAFSVNASGDPVTLDPLQER